MPQGQTESGGIVLAAIRWATSAQRRCHPQEALYLPTFSHLLIVNKLLSLSLFLSLSLSHPASPASDPIESSLRLGLAALSTCFSGVAPCCRNLTYYSALSCSSRYVPSQMCRQKEPMAVRGATIYRRDLPFGFTSAHPPSSATSAPACTVEA